jgi:hypothetical protein
MKTNELFKSSIPELENLPNKPKTFWYPSAGIDFRSIVFLSKYHVDKLQKFHNKDFTKPDLFLFTSLGPEVRDLRMWLKSNKEYILYNDNRTVLIGKNYKELALNRKEEKFVYDSENINLDRIRLPKLGHEAFYFEIEIIGKNQYHYNETHKVIYIEHENIDVFDKIILKNYFDIEYLCATREGLHNGACRKSVVQHIYDSGEGTFYAKHGFKPKFNILFNDMTSRLFERKTSRSEIINTTKNYHYYLPEAKPYDTFWTDSYIYKNEYSNQLINNIRELDILLDSIPDNFN